MSDLRAAMRSLRQSPVFAGSAIVTLAIGLGGTTAAFSLARGVFVLPFDEPGRLMVLSPASGSGSIRLSAAELTAYQEQSRALDELAASRWESVHAYTGDQPILVGVEEITPGYFEMLGVQPVVGRLPRTDAPAVDGLMPALVGYGYWRGALGGADDVVGRTLRIRRRTATGALGDLELARIAGVLPRTFPGRLMGSVPEVALWLQAGDAAADDRSLTVYGRLRPDASPELAQAELDVLAKRLGWDSRPVWASLVDQTRSETAGRHVSIFAAVVAVVFLIVILNLLTLQIARITRRSHDLSIRTALGASTSRLVRPLILEATLLTLLGAVMAWMVAWSVQDLVRVRVPPFLAGLERVTIDVWAFAFAVGLALPIGIVLGLVPVLRASRSNVSLSMHRLATHNSFPHRRLHGAVTLTQTALAVILLVVAALLAHSYGHMLGIDPGFDSRNVRTAEVEMSGAGLTASNYVAISRLLQEIRALPDVEHVAVTDALPLRMRSTVVGVEADTGVAWDFDPRELSRMPVFQPISAGYEHVMAIPLQAGRWIDESDVASGATVAVISEPLANRLWPGRSALGARLRITGAPGPWLTVVGVSRPIRSMHLFHPPSPSVYVPYTSDVLPVATIRRQMTVAARVAAGSPVMLNPVIARWMPDAISTTGSMQSTVEGYLRTPRFQASVLGWLAAVASLLAALGVYSVVAFSAAQRTREFSLRIALGAPASAVVGQMTCQGATPAAIGVIVGLISSLGVTRAFEGYLFGITRMDVSVYAGVLVVGLLLVTIASWIPARRLARVDPMSMLRQE